MDISSKYYVAELDHRLQSTAQCHNINIWPHLTITISWWRWLWGRLGLTNWSRPKPTALLIFCKAFCRLKPKMEELPVEVKVERPKVLEPWVSWDGCHSDMPWKVPVFRFNGTGRDWCPNKQALLLQSVWEVNLQLSQAGLQMLVVRCHIYRSILHM